MSTETVTVVFTDLVGSTALLSRVGEVAAELLRREHFALLRESVEKCNGQEVKNLGDGLMVVFASASDAAAAAVAMQQALERRNRRAPEPLEIRVGVALGDVDVDADESDYFGVPVVQAARLCAVAAGGEILCTDVVAMLAGSRADAAFEPIGELDLKGLNVPVAASRVRWETVAGSEPPPLPARLAAAVPSTFAGRADEERVLSSAWKVARAEARPRVVLLSGEPGIGKTTLSARFARSVHHDGAIVVYGRCDEDLRIPYQPWIEALGSLVQATSEDVLAEHVGASGSDLGRLLPLLVERTGAPIPGHRDSDGDRLALFTCVVDLLERTSEDVPLLMVLDDLHWADLQSLQLLRHVVRAVRPLRVLILGTFRDTDVGAADPLADLLAGLHREQGLDRVSLRGLTDVDVLGLLEQIAGHEIDAAGLALRDAVLAETAGNPFFLGEILRHLAETGTIYQDDRGRWTGDIDVRSVGLPVSVREVVGRRVAALGPDTESLLTQAAVVGRDFDVGLLGGVTGFDEDAVIGCCDAAVNASVLVTTDVPDRYSFAHALIEHTLYDGLSPARRSRVHRRVAEVIEETTADPDGRAGELAYHWGAAVAPTDEARALHYAKVAGERAQAHLAPDEALRWYSAALDLAARTGAGPKERAEVLLGLGIAQRQTGSSAHRETLVGAAWLADEVGDTDLLVQAALANLRGYTSSTGAVAEDRVAVIERALERLSTDDSPERARLLTARVVEHYHDLDIEARRAMGEEATAMARRCCSTVELVGVLYGAAWSLRSARYLDLRSALISEALELIPANNDPVLDFLVYGEARICATERGDVRTMNELAERQFTAAASTTEAWVRWDRDFSKASWAIIDGDLVEAERYAELGLQSGLDKGQPDAWVVYGAQIACIRSHQGRIGELVEAIEQALADAPLLTSYQAVLAYALVQRGRPEEPTSSDGSTTFSAAWTTPIDDSPRPTSST